MDDWVHLTCPLCGTTLRSGRAQFPEMAHADVVAMNFLQKAMEVHWTRFCEGPGRARAAEPPRPELLPN